MTNKVEAGAEVEDDSQIIKRYSPKWYEIVKLLVPWMKQNDQLTSKLEEEDNSSLTIS